MTSISTDDVFVGLWTDWTRGGVRGMTLTLGPTNSIILTNSLAMFVTLCSIQIWAIVRYMLHLTGPKPQKNPESPQLTQQLILRNTGSAVTTAILTIELIWDYRKRAWRALIRPYSIVLWAGIYACLFTSAGVFSNKAVSADGTNGSSTVLLRSKACGNFNQSYVDLTENLSQNSTAEFDEISEWSAKLGKEVQRSLQYAQQCYAPTREDAEASSTCHTLKSTTIGNMTFLKGSCPFAKGICNSNAEVMTFDTGKIDSHLDLGINARKEDRLTYQRIATCAVLNDTSRLTGWDGEVANTSSPTSPKDNAYAYYGPNVLLGTDWTYAYSNFASYYNNFTARATTPYQLDVELSPGLSDPQYTYTDFEPIAEIAQDDADVVLVFLSFTGMYLVEIDDPWFAAHKPHTFVNPSLYLRKRYSRDSSISTLACTEKHNFCLSDGTCTGFGGIDQVQNNAKFNQAMNSHQKVTFDKLMYSTYYASIFSVIQNLSQTTRPLLATSVIQTGKSGAVISASLPADQFKKEIEFWYSIAMAQLQRHIVLWATGEIAADKKYIIPAKQEQDVWFCENVIVPSTVHQSFSVLAIINIFVFGTILIVVGVFIDDLTDWGARRLRKAPPGVNWRNDGMLALQRRKTKARVRSLFSHRANNSHAGSPQIIVPTPQMPTTAAFPNSARVSSQILPPVNANHLSVNINTPPSTSPQLSQQQYVSGFSQYTKPHSPRWRHISIHEMHRMSSVTPKIRIDNSHCSSTKVYPESAPENFYILPQMSESPVTNKTTRILDWMKTLHPENIPYTHGNANLTDPKFRQSN